MRRALLSCTLLAAIACRSADAPAAAAARPKLRVLVTPHVSYAPLMSADATTMES